MRYEEIEERKRERDRERDRERGCKDRSSKRRLASHNSYRFEGNLEANQRTAGRSDAGQTSHICPELHGGICYPSQ